MPASPAEKAPKKKRRSRRTAPKRLAPKAILYGAAPLIADEAGLAQATALLHGLDPKTIGHLAAFGGPPPLRLRAPGFAGLAAIIVSQQVSVASADAIFGRLEQAIAPLDAPGLGAASDEALQRCGLSAAKIRTLRALARAVVAGELDLERLGDCEAPAAHQALVAIKGIGPWTADIFLLFCLGHSDAFPAGDLALQEAAKLALGRKTRPDARQLERIAERWRPYRGVAARMLWAYYRIAKRRAGVMMAPAAN